MVPCLVAGMSDLLPAQPATEHTVHIQALYNSAFLADGVASSCPDARSSRTAGWQLYHRPYCMLSGCPLSGSLRVLLPAHYAMGRKDQHCWMQKANLLVESLPKACSRVQAMTGHTNASGCGVISNQRKRTEPVAKWVTGCFAALPVSTFRTGSEAASVQQRALQDMSFSGIIHILCYGDQTTLTSGLSDWCDHNSSTLPQLATQMV